MLGALEGYQARGALSAPFTDTSLACGGLAPIGILSTETIRGEWGVAAGVSRKREREKEEAAVRAKDPLLSPLLQHPGIFLTCLFLGEENSLITPLCGIWDKPRLPSRYVPSNKRTSPQFLHLQHGPGVY